MNIGYVQAAQWHTASRVSPKLVSKEFNNNKNKKEFNKNATIRDAPKYQYCSFLTLFKKGGSNPC